MRPVVANGPALEDGNDDERYAKRAVEYNSGPDDPLDITCRENALVEEQQRKLQQHQVGEVENGYDEEYFHKRGDCVVGQCPNISAQSIRKCTSVDDDCVWNTAQEGDHDEVVVPAKLSPRDDKFVSYPYGHENSRDDTQDNADSTTECDFAPNGRTTRGYCGILRSC